LAVEAKVAVLAAVAAVADGAEVADSEKQSSFTILHVNYDRKSFILTMPLGSVS
jgi:hypothetical protein